MATRSSSHRRTEVEPLIQVGIDYPSDRDKAMPEMIQNAATGDSIEFIETAEQSGGRVSHFYMTLAPGSDWARSPRHFHPFQKETFEVVEGELHLHAGKTKHVLRPGDPKVVVERFQLHAFWNESDQPTKFIAEIFDPRNIERGIRLTYKLSQDGAVNERNIPKNPLVTLLLMSWFDSYFPIIPWRLQRVGFGFGASIARLFGYPKNDD